MRPPTTPRRRTTPPPPEPEPEQPQTDAEAEPAAPKASASKPKKPKGKKPKRKNPGEKKAPKQQQSKALAKRERPAREPSPEDDDLIVGGAQPASMGARRDERRRARTRLWMVRAGIIAVVVAIVAAAVWVLAFSSLLALKPDRITVQGANDLVDPNAVNAIAAEHADTPLIRLDTGAIAEQFETMPGVADAAVNRDWPGGLQIAITERIPVAASPTDEGWVVLDAEGTHLTTEPERRPELPEVTVPLDGSDDAGRILDAVLTAMSDMPPELRERIGQIGAESTSSIEFTIAESGARVLWGSADESALKGEVLTVLLQQPAATYDVSAPRTPTTS